MTKKNKKPPVKKTTAGKLLLDAEVWELYQELEATHRRMIANWKAKEQFAHDIEELLSEKKDKKAVTKKKSRKTGNQP